MLMVAGFEKYFQIAHCFRDEDLRADRQPEHTQIDLEWSFIEQEDILQLMEEMYTSLVREFRPDVRLIAPFPRFTFEEAMNRYGSDKPDIRYGLELRDLSAAVRGTDFGVFKSVLAAGGQIKGLAVPGGAQFSRKQIDELTVFAQQGGAKGLVSMALTGEGTLETLTAENVRSPVSRFFSIDQVRAMASAAGAGRGDLILIVAGEAEVVASSLDLVRRELARRLELADPNTFAFCFVLDFPLLTWNEEIKWWEPTHHPFTSPRAEDIPLLDSDPGKTRAQHYDLVCNGWELGSGSIRIHSREVQEKMLSLFKIGPDEARHRFGHMLDAFEFGAPPHGGFGHGLDRVVALLAGERDIREVIAFPKTKSASDPMTGAPSPADPDLLELLHIKVVYPEKKD
jgi:aspartyl-tRNA synthetase